MSLVGLWVSALGGPGFVKEERFAAYLCIQILFPSFDSRDYCGGVPWLGTHTTASLQLTLRVCLVSAHYILSHATSWRPNALQYPHLTRKVYLAIAKRLEPDTSTRCLSHSSLVEIDHRASTQVTCGDVGISFVGSNA